MKQLKLIDFVFFLFFFTESLTLPTKITQKFIEENIEYIAIIAFAQYVQEATFEDVEILVKDMVEYKDRCVANKTLPECFKLPNNVLQEKICAMEGLPQKHNFSHCCSKVDFERRPCFFFNKKADVGFLPPFPTLDPEEKCQAFKNSRKSFLNHYIYEIARRNPFVFAPTLLSVAARFEEVANTCCEERHKVSCFQTRAAAVIQYLKAFSSYQKNVCGAYLKFGTKVLNFINIAVLSQKFPKIEFKELTSLIEDVSSKYEGCCEGDVVQCIRDTSKVMNHICSKQDSISSKIKECCEKKMPERGECIINSNKDDRPKDLREAKFTDSENICQERDTDPDNFFAEFTYEYSRNHPDLSIPETTAKHLKIEWVSVFIWNQTDKCSFSYLIRLTKTAPQLSTEELISLGEKMVMALTTCCTLSEEFACVDNLVDLVLGELCGINENRTINPAVDHCCKTNFAFRRHCFEGLKADKTYIPPPTTKDLFTFNADLCQAQDEELQRKKDRFLVNLVKLKRELTDEELQSLFTSFANAVEKCCSAEGPEACFNEEVVIFHFY
uniref:Afamin n=1 Tax=Propithecus coquereli TaxID=379532 RepID=A0A2K6FHT8_PROCO